MNVCCDLFKIPVLSIVIKEQKKSGCFKSDFFLVVYFSFFRLDEKLFDAAKIYLCVEAKR